MTLRLIACAVWIGAAGAVTMHGQYSSPPVAAVATIPDSARAAFETAQRDFYSGRYEQAAATALELAVADHDVLNAYELRTSALHFLIRRHMGDGPDREAALKACADCAPLLQAFFADIKKGQALARAKVQASPNDLDTLFLLGKIDLNYVWMQLATLGKKTGWNEYWEARHAMENILKREPKNVRAMVAKAWIEFIVDTRTPWGLGWVLGGGNRKHALSAIREATTIPEEFFVTTEARFALWEMLAKNRDFKDAAVVARGLMKDFPDNRELVRFVDTHGQ